jgi:predicted DNA-binding transcriptional regulator YafY
MRDTQCAVSERFDLPADFVVDQYFQGEFGIWRDTTPHKVVVEFDAQAADYVRMRTVHASQKLQSIAGGGLRLTMTVGNLTPVVSWVLEWGGRARVVEPPELIERVKGELEAALALYGDEQKSSPKRNSR